MTASDSWLLTMFWSDSTLSLTALSLFAAIGHPPRYDGPITWWRAAGRRFRRRHPLGMAACRAIANNIAEGRPS